MSLRTMTRTTLYCTSCGWAEELREYDMPRAWCPNRCEAKEVVEKPLKGFRAAVVKRAVDLGASHGTGRASADHTSCSRRRFGSGCVPHREGE